MLMPGSWAGVVPAPAPDSLAGTAGGAAARLCIQVVQAPGTHDEYNQSLPPPGGVRAIEPLSISGFTTWVRTRRLRLQPLPISRKRSIVVDTLGLLLLVMVTAASVSDNEAVPFGVRPAAC